MTPDQLWQMNPDAVVVPFNHHNAIREGLRLAKEHDVLVEAAIPKPDYEAAWGYARSESNLLALNERGDDLVALDKVDVFALIDRAYGKPEADEFVVKVKADMAEFQKATDAAAAALSGICHWVTDRKPEADKR